MQALAVRHCKVRMRAHYKDFDYKGSGVCLHKAVSQREPGEALDKVGQPRRYGLHLGAFQHIGLVALSHKAVQHKAVIYRWDRWALFQQQSNCRA